MPIIEIDVLEGIVEVRIEERDWHMRLDDSMRLVRQCDGTRRVVDLGGLHSSEAIRANTVSELRRVFDAPQFDPDLAVAYVEYCSILWTNGLPLLRAIPASFERRHVRLTWPGWTSVAPTGRRVFVESVARLVASLSINGRTLVRYPLYRSVLNLGPIIDGA